jgi:hypothetical protein
MRDLLMVNDFFTLIKYSFIHAFICIILFDTDVIVEYCKNIPILNKLLKINDYLKYKEMTGENQLYISYISSIYHKFLIKLISCPLCLGFWVNICIALYLNDLFAFFGLYCSSVMIYGIFKKLYYGTNN